MNQGRLRLDEVVKKCGTYLLIMFVTSEVTMFHLSLTVVLSFNIKYSSLKLSKCFRYIVSFISNENVAFRAAFAFG